MKLRRLEVKNFRKLDRVVIEDLGPGLNVIVGDNEAGKSTLLAALRAALFDRHRISGQAASAMQPYEQNVRPTVEVEFDKDGVGYRIRKAFCQRPEATLEGNGKAWSGDAADQQLAAILGFTPAAAGRSKREEHHGVFGLLWVEQGTAHQPLRVGAGRERLNSALEQQVGEMTGGRRGRVLLAAAETRRDEFWDKRGNLRGRAREIEKAVVEVKVRAEEVRLQAAELEAKVERLEAVEAMMARHAEEGSLATAKARRFAAEAALVQLQGLEQAARTAAARLEHVKLQQQAAANQLARRRELQGQVDSAAANLENRSREATMARAVLAQRESAEAIARNMTSEAAEFQRQAVRSMHRIEAAELRDRLQRLQAQLQAAEAAEAKSLEAIAAAGAETITLDGLEALEAIEADVRRSKAQLEAAAVRISLFPHGTARLEIDGVGHGKGEVTLARDSVLVIPGYGNIEVRPGGGIANLQHAVEAEAARLRDALAALGQSDVAGARAALSRRQQAASAGAHAASLLASLAPGGLAVLRQEFAALQTHSSDLAGPQAGFAADEEADDRDKVRLRHREALSRVQRAAMEAEGAAAALQDARTVAAVADERLEAAHAAAARAAAALEAGRLSGGEAELETAHEVAAAELAAASSDERLARRLLADAEPESTRLALAEARRAETALEAELRALADSKLALESELGALGRDGLGERQAELTGETELLTRQLAALRLEADAARLLHDTLLAAERDSKERWLAPLHERVAPYLSLLTTNGSVTLEKDTLELDRVVRGGVSEPFSGLSLGAREQMAVVTRLAFADILRDSGQACCVVLDDALVNADDSRLERMRQVLDKAAERQQIIILSCRERDFAGMGIPIRRM